MKRRLPLYRGGKAEGLKGISTMRGDAALTIEARLLKSLTDEVMRYAKIFAREHRVNERRNAGQEHLLDWAKSKGYRKGDVIDFAGALRRKDGPKKDARLLALRKRFAKWCELEDVFDLAEEMRKS